MISRWTPDTLERLGRAGARIVDADTLMVAELLSPKHDPHRWSQYLEAAEASYGLYGLERAVRRDDLEMQPAPAFWLITDLDTGTLLGGIRVHGPYTSLHEVWALDEFRRHHGVNAIAGLVHTLFPEGVIETKGAFTTPAAKGRDASCLLGRVWLATMDLLGVRYSIATSGQHTLEGWSRIGCRVPLPEVTIPYPDNRYTTVLVVHDKHERSTNVTGYYRAQLDRDMNQLRIVDLADPRPRHTCAQEPRIAAEAGGQT